MGVSSFVDTGYLPGLTNSLLSSPPQCIGEGLGEGLEKAKSTDLDTPKLTTTLNVRKLFS